MSNPWWKSSLVYQIYPASFYRPASATQPNDPSSTVGTIPGIIEKVPYIASLGFDALWLSPIFASPQTDMGYDISDYRLIDSRYGTVEDVKQLIQVLHSTQVAGSDKDGSTTTTRPMRLLLDLVVNHTSNEHPWFVESASSRTNPKSDWYFWRDAKTDPTTGARRPPNNWRSIFGGSAWHYVESRSQYYLALFLPTQPDLNWEVREMRDAIYDDMRFWLDLGIDGWRIDSMNLMSKNPELPDAEVTIPGEEFQDGSKWYGSGPRIHEYLAEMRREVFDRYGEGEKFTVGEMGSVDTEEGIGRYVSVDRKELNCVFAGMDLDFGPTGKYNGDDPFHLGKLKAVTEKWQLAMKRLNGWNSIYLDNHDSGRSLTRYGYRGHDQELRARAAKMLATYLCTLSGTVFALQGQEIGTANLGDEVGAESYIDVEGSNWYKKVHKERGGAGSNVDMDDVLEQMRLKSRDHGRLPVQWNDGPNAGFCEEGLKPWMTVNPDYKRWNVESQIGQKGSVLEYWKQIIQLRRRYEEVLVHGDFKLMKQTPDDVMAYERWTTGQAENEKLVILLSFTEEERVVKLNKTEQGNRFEVLSSNIAEGEVKLNNGSDEITLRPFEAVVLKCC